METMNLRKANAERKDIDKRLMECIRGGSSNNMVIAFYSAKKPFIGTLTPQEAEQKIVSTYQRFTDLIARREKLNKAVLHANATTMVKVPKFVNLETYNPADTEEISIAAAINRKKYYETFLSGYFLLFLKNSQKYTISNYNDLVNTMNDEYERNVANQFGVTSTQSSKARIEYAESIKDNYKVTLLDPLKLSDKIDKIENMVLDYIRDIDSIISNASENTVITIE